jgi:hypothetical protein
VTPELLPWRKACCSPTTFVGNLRNLQVGTSEKHRNMKDSFVFKDYTGILAGAHENQLIRSSVFGYRAGNVGSVLETTRGLRIHSKKSQSRLRILGMFRYILRYQDQSTDMIVGFTCRFYCEVVGGCRCHLINDLTFR